MVEAVEQLQMNYEKFVQLLVVKIIFTEKMF